LIQGESSPLIKLQDIFLHPGSIGKLGPEMTALIINLYVLSVGTRMPICAFLDACDNAFVYMELAWENTFVTFDTLMAILGALGAPMPATIVRLATEKLAARARTVRKESTYWH
jgi:hypothetical protein